MILFTLQLFLSRIIPWFSPNSSTSVARICSLKKLYHFFSKFTDKHLYQSLFWWGCRPTTNSIQTHILLWISQNLSEQVFLGHLLIQKQSPGVALKKRCSLKFSKIHRKTPVSESLFKKGDSGTVVFLWILWNFCKTPFFIEHFRWLLLLMAVSWILL